MNEKLNRREFIRLQAKNSLFLAAAGSGFFWPRMGFASAMPDIGVARGAAERV
jgi:hypothetical protein